jgi:signal transduction histidine kinase
MEWTGWLGWVLAAVLGAVALWLASRKPGGAGATPSGVAPRPPQALPAGGSAGVPGEVSPVETPTGTDAEARALRQALGFLDRVVLPQLEAARAALPGDSRAVDPLDRALDAMGDLAFFADPPPDESPAHDNLATVIQESVREYTIETRIPVRVHAPAHALHATVLRESLKDAVFLLLANAGRFSEGKPIDVFIEEAEPTGFQVRVVDAGPGFSDEALSRALEPFWSTDPLGVGMGLPQARARVAEMKGRLSLRNQDAGGAEVVLVLPDAGPAA